jgi:hypothetical protein
MSDRPVPLGRDAFNRQILLMTLRSWNEWPRDLLLPSLHFCLLLAGDARDASDELIGTLAKRALDRGCVYVCVWGPDCGRVEACFDRECAERERLDQTPVVLTVSHPTGTLDEALEFVTETAFPHGAYAETCRAALVAVVGNEDWVKSIRVRFAT